MARLKIITTITSSRYVQRSAFVPPVLRGLLFPPSLYSASDAPETETGQSAIIIAHEPVYDL